jgi:hypothetical protein
MKKLSCILIMLSLQPRVDLSIVPGEKPLKIERDGLFQRSLGHDKPAEPPVRFLSPPSKSK